MTNPLSLIPLVIVHGTLGSGKTTVVRELLKTPALRGAFIIENEFAHESIDGMALGDEVHEDQLAELSGGCVCCSSLTELEAVLVHLAARPWSGPVILETTGVASAADLLVKLYTSTTFINRFSLAQSIFVLDAAAVSPELACERGREILSSDIIALSKIDIVAPSVVQKLENVIQSISPDAAIVLLDRGRAAWSSLVSLDQLSRVEYRLADIAVQPAGASNHTLMVYAVVYPEQLFTEQSLRRAVVRLFSSLDMRMVRVKGFVAGAGDSWWHVEATAHQIDITPSQTRTKKVLVCIGEGVTAERVVCALND